MIMSFERSRMVRKPAWSMLPTSPVCSHRPRSVFAVASRARKSGGRELVHHRAVVIALWQAGDGHRRLALAVELVEARAEELDRAQRIGDVHGRTAIDERAQAFGRARALRGEQP